VRVRVFRWWCLNGFIDLPETSYEHCAAVVARMWNLLNPADIMARWVAEFLWFVSWSTNQISWLKLLRVFLIGSK
jgi:hypothetical protein